MKRQRFARAASLGDVFANGLARAAWVACALMLGMATPARADVDLEIIDPTLKDLQFGQNFGAISDWIGKRLDKVYLPRIARTSDANERARLRARRDQEIVLMRNAEVQFDGRDTGLGASIIAGEFGVGTDESLFSYKEGAETHYFFMHDDKLWKYARVMIDGPTFLGRVATFQNAFGAPTNMTDESDGAGGRSMLSAVWKNAGFDLRLINRRVVYGGDLFVIEDRGVATQLAGLREKAKRPGLGGVDPSVDAFLLDDPDTYGAPPPKVDPPVDPKKSPKGPKKNPKTPRQSQ